MNGSPDTPRDYLKKPYARVLTPDADYGGYTAEILEFPGCVTEGDTPHEALENLEEAAEGWIEAALSMGQDIPEPSDAQGYGGRVALRLPRSLHRRAMQLAERDGTSLNQFLVAAIAERVGAGTLYARMTQRLEQRAMEAAAYSLHTSINRGMSILEGLWPVSRETSVHPIDSPQSGSGHFFFGSMGRSDPDDVSGERNLTTHGG
jgi:predicted RNase H-like HicB family nuclease